MTRRKYNYARFLLCLFGLLLFFFYQYQHNLNHGYFDLDDVLTQSARVLIPIDRPWKAAEFALTQKLIPLDNLNQVEEQIDQPVEWKLLVQRKNSLWQVTLMVPNLLPAYACTVQFTESGEPGPSGYEIEPCGWRK